MKIYISGRISGLKREDVHNKFTQAETKLKAQGHEVLNPLKNGMPEVTDYATHMIVDIIMLFQADAIYMLHDWIESQGAITELNAARATGKQIIYETEPKYEIILKAIADVTGVGKEEILGSVRRVEFVYARMLVAILMREHGASIGDIRKFLNKQYTSVLHYMNIYRAELETNQRFRQIDIAVRQRLEHEKFTNH